MENKKIEEKIIEDMEYLVKLLHQEWERSGKTNIEISIQFQDREEIKRRLTAVIIQQQKLLECKELTFEQSMALSKECFILLRLVKKINQTEDKMSKKEPDARFDVELDKEECELFFEIIKVQEG